MYIEAKDDKTTSVYLEKDDKCHGCINQEVCPLLAGLQNEIVILRYENIAIEKCPMFCEQFEEDTLFEI